MSSLFFTLYLQVYQSYLNIKYVKGIQRTGDHMLRYFQWQHCNAHRPHPAAIALLPPNSMSYNFLHWYWSVSHSNDEFQFFCGCFHPIGQPIPLWIPLPTYEPVLGCKLAEQSPWTWSLAQGWPLQSRVFRHFGSSNWNSLVFWYLREISLSFLFWERNCIDKTYIHVSPIIGTMK